MKGTICGGLVMLATALPLLSGCAGGGRIPSDATAVVTPLTLEPPPIYALLGYRRELELTSEQVAALDSIAQGVQDQNRPLVRELQERTRERSRQPGVMVVTAEGEPVLEEIRANQRRAGEAVEAVLSEGQRATVCELFGRARSGPRGRAQQARPEADNGGRDPRILGPAGWHWCAAADGAAQGAPAPASR